MTSLKHRIIQDKEVIECEQYQAFLEENGYAYIRLNPLETKKQLDSLQICKTDKIDTNTQLKSKIAEAQSLCTIDLSL